MLTIKSLSLVVATIATLSISAHAAERQANPLHPAYYAQRATIAFEYLPTQPYVENGNPLHPAFAKTAFRTEWMTAGAIDGKLYVDERNPLNPAFKR